MKVSFVIAILTVFSSAVFAIDAAPGPREVQSNITMGICRVEGQTIKVIDGRLLTNGIFSFIPAEINKAAIQKEVEKRVAEKSANYARYVTYCNDSVKLYPYEPLSGN